MIYKISGHIWKSRNERKQHLYFVSANSIEEALEKGRLLTVGSKGYIPKDAYIEVTEAVLMSDESVIAQMNYPP